MRGGGKSKAIIGFSGTPLQNDTVEISTKQKPTQNQDKKMSPTTKILLGLAGLAVTIYGCAVAHRAITKPSIEKVGQDFSGIFRKDISKDEAQKLIEKYKEIFNENDTETFIEKCFNQAKKDFGWENIDIKVEILPKDTNKRLGGGYKPLGVVFDDTSKTSHQMILNNKVIAINPTATKQSIFSSIMHELTHMKQHEMAYRADKQGFIDAIKESRFGTIEKHTKLYDEATEVYINEVEKIYGDVWGKMPKIEKGTEEYELAQKYLENIKNYKNDELFGYDEYRNQLIEKEAFNSGNKAKEIYKYFESIW